jgi:hypothetical protein
MIAFCPLRNLVKLFESLGQSCGHFDVFVARCEAANYSVRVHLAPF